MASARNCSPVFMHINREPSPVRYDSLPKPLMSSIQERREPDDRDKSAPVSLSSDEESNPLLRQHLRHSQQTQPGKDFRGPTPPGVARGSSS
ncbi:hypothetical protein G5714_024645 [Onychostoma macrolepis]|uniref:Uncharacterized protein n=1 Tax=Onychostoma macrolepis TaxID=369639 RepID=A0A7J6BLC8_9TELE|nr:hypothetical protein G5714_024645 [Onychostoma macrolepis]